MKRVLVGLSYGLQGIGNLALALFLFSSLTPGGFAFGFFLLVPSISSLVAVWFLFTSNVDPTYMYALGWGTLASALFIILYGILGRQAFSNIVRGYYVYENSIPLLVSSIVLVLNAVSIFGLFSIDKEEKMHEYVPKDKYASPIPKGRFCKQCGKLASVELGSCPN